MSAAGMVAMVDAAAGSARYAMSPAQVSKTFPAGIVAMTATTVPAV